MNWRRCCERHLVQMESSLHAMLAFCTARLGSFGAARVILDRTDSKEYMASSKVRESKKQCDWACMKSARK